MDKVDILFEAYNFVLMNPKAKHATISWVFVDGDRVYAVFCGRGARRTSNAMYHAIRAVGMRGVRREPNGKCWVVSYV